MVSAGIPVSESGPDEAGQQLRRIRHRLSLLRRVLARQGGGWPFHLLTEDIEFTIDNVVRGVKIGYCPEAILYDEQPVDFRQSWAQRLRWSRGYLQVFRRYGGRLFVTPEWTPIRHTRALSPRQICGEFREDAG